MMLLPRTLLVVCTTLAISWPGIVNGQSAAQTVRPMAGNLQLTFLGMAGWQISDGHTVILVDPFLSLDSLLVYWKGTGTDAGPDDLVPLDTATIHAYVKRADYILVTHGHIDHALEAGYIAKRTGSVIVAHQSAANLARAYGVADSAIITVRGGEDYEFGNFSLRVIPSIHSALGNKRYFNWPTAGNTPAGVRAPLKVRDFQEGGSLAYLLRMAGHELLIMGSMNYIEREMEGLRPDVALVGANRARREIHRYTPRLLRALGNPATVIATHCCDRADDKEARAFSDEVRAASPRTRVIVPERFKTIVLPARN